jgi:hypothetical protein
MNLRMNETSASGSIVPLVRTLSDKTSKRPGPRIESVMSA